MANEAKIYTKGFFIKEKTVGNKNLLAISIKVQDFINFLKENVNEKGYVNLDCWQNTSPDRYGNSHNAVLNTYKAKESAPVSKARNQQEQEDFDDTNDGLPF